MKKMICLFLFVLIVCSCTTPVSAVDSVLGMAAPMANTGTVEEERAKLQNSDFVSWTGDMISYNCYAYALGRTDWLDPGDLSGQTNAVISDYTDLVGLVKEDLYDTGHKCVKTQTTRPTSTNGWAMVIAARMQTSEPEGENDYHFAKMIGSRWYHKPSYTALLKFKNISKLTGTWTNEALLNGVVYNSDTIDYDSPITYILVNINHSPTTDSVWTENHYHSGSLHYYEYDYVCSNCGGLSGNVYWTTLPCTGSNCILPWSITPEYEVE